MFYAPDLSASAITLDADESKHALGSRRLREGDPIQVFDGRGQRADGTLIIQSERRHRTAVVQVTARHTDPAPTGLHLYTAAPKGDRLRFMVEKCTELGVVALHLVQWERSVAAPSESGAEKLHRIALEACKQSQRLWLPEIQVNVTPAAFLTCDLPRCFGHQTAAPTSLSTGKDIACAIGPEGGFTATELDQLNEVAQPIQLARHILRTETACIAAAAAVNR